VAQASDSAKTPTVFVPRVYPVGSSEGQSAGLTKLAEQEGAIKAAAREPHVLISSGNLGDRLFTGVTTVFAASILATLVMMVAVLAIQSRESISTFGLGFITGTTWNSVTGVFGAAPAILGTLYSSLLALLLAAPVGVLIAVFLSEMAPARIRTIFGFLVELLAAVPSIVYGLWALFVLVPLVRDHFSGFLSTHFGNFFLFSNMSATGYGLLTAALVLSIMILPTIAAISRDVMSAVPRAQREAMYALGATRWETTWKVVVPYARSGIIGGIILGLGRAIGETMAAQMVIGNSQTLSASLLAPATTITATLVNQFQDASAGLFKSSLVELALILMIITVLLNAVARLLVWSVTRKYAS
jgi:phosphate transport system permease protein